MGRRSDIIGVTDATGSTFQATAVTVTDVATKLPTVNLDNRKAITVFNASNTNWLYLGNSDVTTATGYPVLPYQGLPFDMCAGAQLYGICETGKTATIKVLEVDNA